MTLKPALRRDLEALRESSWKLRLVGDMGSSDLECNDVEMATKANITETVKETGACHDPVQQRAIGVPVEQWRYSIPRERERIE